MEATAQEIDEWLRQLQDSDLLIIVEGIKDKKALLSLGMKRVIHLDRALYDVVEKIAAAEKEVVILTDLDKKGKQLYGKLRKDSQAHGVKVANGYREILQRKTKVSHIEGLHTYINKRREDDADE